MARRLATMARRKQTAQSSRTEDTMPTPDTTRARFPEDGR